ncbi:DNA polymerase II [archaeon]|nr:DNA polymerase II [archaeon]|tara:strand:- start:5371 stop:6861 length:1491 start_codon:yes stop_codon:yes gene_type:complete
MNIAEYFLKKGYLVNSGFNVEGAYFFDDENVFSEELVLENIGEYKFDNIVVKEVEEKKIEVIENKEDKIVLDVDNNEKRNIKIVRCYREDSRKREVGDFVTLMKYKFEYLKNILLNREELQDTLSINKVLERKDREYVSIIGIVKEKRENKTGSFTLTLEDVTGEIRVLFKKDSEFFDDVKDIVLDEVIGVTGSKGDDIVFVNNFYIPDIPIYNELKKYDEEEYVVFTSDVHVGSNVFFEDNFKKFISWLNLEYGNEKQKEIAKKVKHVFIAGDLVEGIGIYPGQEKDLKTQDIYEQYEEFAKYVNSIRKDITVVLIAGNHDAVRLAEPQPVVDNKTAPSLYKNENVIFTTNPSVVNICAKDGFPGFNILLYHGYSFVYFSEEVESIRKNGRLDRCDLIMKFLLQRRHLAPSHGSNLYIPDSNNDNLIIDMIPDFFVSGHIHKVSATNYRGITLLNCGCWIDQTEYQEKQGMIPDPNRIMVANLQTRDIKILNFGD